MIRLTLDLQAYNDKFKLNFTKEEVDCTMLKGDLTVISHNKWKNLSRLGEEIEVVMYPVKNDRLSRSYFTMERVKLHHKWQQANATWRKEATLITNVNHEFQDHQLKGTGMVVVCKAQFEELDQRDGGCPIEYFKGKCN